MQNRKSKAFSLIEISIVLIIVGLLVAGIVQGSILVDSSRLGAAQNLTKNSDARSIKGLVAWYETTLPESLLSGEVGNENFDSEDLDDGDPIKVWRDVAQQSMKKDDAIAPNNNSRPIYIKRGMHHLPVLKFNGAQSLNLPDGTIPYGNSPYTIFLVFSISDETTFQSAIIGGGDYVSNSSNTIYYETNGSIRNTWQSADVSSSAGSVQFGKASVFTINYSGFSNSTARSIYKNGILSTSAAATANTVTKFNNVIGIANGVVSSYLKGNLAEIIIYDRSLKSNEREVVEGYLLRKWSIKR